MNRRTRRGGSTSGRPVLGRAAVQVAAGRGVRLVDPVGHAGEVAVAQVPQVAGRGGAGSPEGSTCSVTPGGSAARSAANRCRRAISKATSATSHGRVGGRSGRSIRPTCST